MESHTDLGASFEITSRLGPEEKAQPPSSNAVASAVEATRITVAFPRINRPTASETQTIVANVNSRSAHGIAALGPTSDQQPNAMSHTTGNQNLAVGFIVSRPRRGTALA
jgi:hypothetical protein